MTNTQELKNRIEAKQHELQSRLAELKADSHAKAKEERERIETRLDELQKTIKDGWDNLSEQAAGKLNDWLSKS